MGWQQLEFAPPPILGGGEPAESAMRILSVDRVLQPLQFGLRVAPLEQLRLESASDAPAHPACGGDMGSFRRCPGIAVGAAR